MAHSKLWLGTGVLALAGVLFLGLGRWQLDRAAVNRSLEAAFLAAVELAAVELPVADPEAMRYRRVVISGRYLPHRQVLLDNMTLAGVAGYQVLTPFRLQTGSLVLVNRGFVPAGPDRSELPEVALRSPGVSVSGRIDRLPRAAMTLGDAVADGTESLVRLSFPDEATLAGVLGEPVEPYQILLDEDASDGFARVWTPDLDRDEQNIAYAVQWFALAGLAFVLAVGVVVRSRQRAPQS